MFVVRHAFVSRITLLHAPACCSGPYRSFPSCLPTDGDESAEVSYCRTDPFPAAAGRYAPRQSHCGRLSTPCSVITASNFARISHRSRPKALQYLCFICTKTEKSIFLSTSFLQASHGSSRDFPICSFLRSNLGFPQGFCLGLPWNHSLPQTAAGLKCGSLSIFPISLLYISFFPVPSRQPFLSQLHHLESISSLFGLGKHFGGLLLCLCAPSGSFRTQR